jgi:hypothetical protein
LEVGIQLCSWLFLPGEALSAACGAGDSVCVLVAVVIVPPLLGGAAFAVSFGVAWHTV